MTILGAEKSFFTALLRHLHHCVSHSRALTKGNCTSEWLFWSIKLFSTVFIYCLSRVSFSDFFFCRAFHCYSSFFLSERKVLPRFHFIELLTWIPFMLNPLVLHRRCFSHIRHVKIVSFTKRNSGERKKEKRANKFRLENDVTFLHFSRLIPDSELLFKQWIHFWNISQTLWSWKIVQLNPCAGNWLRGP